MKVSHFLILLILGFQSGCSRNDRASATESDNGSIVANPEHRTSYPKTIKLTGKIVENNHLAKRYPFYLETASGELYALDIHDLSGINFGETYDVTGVRFVLTEHGKEQYEKQLKESLLDGQKLPENPITSVLHDISIDGWDPPIKKISPKEENFFK